MKRKKVPMNIYVDKDVFRSFQKIAEKEGSSASQWIEYFMLYATDQRKPNPLVGMIRVFEEAARKTMVEHFGLELKETKVSHARK